MSDDDEKRNVKTVVHFMGTTVTITVDIDIAEKITSCPNCRFMTFDGGGTANPMVINMNAITYFEVIHE